MNNKPTHNLDPERMSHAVEQHDENRKIVAVEPGLDAGLAALLVNADALQQLDVDKVAKLVQLQRELTADRARKAFAEALTAVQGKLRPVVRRGKNTHTKSTYAKIDDVLHEATPLLVKHGFSWSVSQRDGAPENMLRVCVQFRHVDGHHEEHWMDAPADKTGAKGKSTKTGVQAVGSTWTYATRRVIMGILGIETTEDDDAEGARDGGPVQKEHVAQIIKRAERVGAPLDRLCKALGVKRIDDLTLAEGAMAMAMIDDWRRAQEKKQQRQRAEQQNNTPKENNNDNKDN